MVCRQLTNICKTLIKKHNIHYSYGNYIQKNKIRDKNKRINAIIYFLQHTR